MGQLTGVLRCYGQGSCDQGNAGTHYSQFNNTGPTWCGYSTSGVTTGSWSSWYTFDTASLSAATTIWEARLQAFSDINPSQSFQYGYTTFNVAGEGFDTYNNSISGFSSAGSVGTTPSSPYAYTWLDVTGFVQQRAGQPNGRALTLNKLNSSNGLYEWRSRADNSYYPRIVIYYGLPLTGLVVTGATRSISATWDSILGADSYQVWLDGVSQGNTGATSWSTTGVHSGSHTIQVAPFYSGRGNTTSQSVSANVNTGTAPLVSATGDNPRRKEVHVVPSGGTTGDSTEIQINNTANTAAIINQTVGVNATTDIAMDSYAAGTYYAYARTRWNDGDIGGWGGGIAFTITQPTITNLTPTTNELRQASPSWDRITDCASYSVVFDSDAAISIPNTVGTGSGTNYTYNTGSTRVSITRLNLKSGAHSVTVTPVYTNGYTGAVTPLTTTNTVVLPTAPTGSTATGDSPAKRQIAAVAPQTPASFYNAASWDFRRDGLDSTIVNTTSTTATISTVPAGSHTLEMRAHWADGDVSSWISVGSYTTTSPAAVAPTTRQRTISGTAPVVTQNLAAGGTIPANTYYIATSVNLGGAKATDASAPDTTRPINESSVTPTQTVTLALGDTVTVPRPANAVTGDTWNVYIGTDRNVLSRGYAGATVFENVAFASTTVTLTSYTSEGNKAKIGKVDIQWTAPSGVGDAPTSYLVERADANPPNSSTGIPGTYVSTATKIGTGLAGLYGTGNTKFWENNLDTKYYFYRVTAIYNNGLNAGDFAPVIDVGVV